MTARSIFAALATVVTIAFFPPTIAAQSATNALPAGMTTYKTKL